MYANYFGFRDIPFRQLSDPRHVYMSAEFETARAELLEAVNDDARVVLLTGHAGTGKTKLLRHLHAYLEARRPIYYLPFSPLQIETFIAQTAFELDIELDAEPNTNLFDVFQAGLRSKAERHRRPVLLVDDAHNLGCDVLENLIDLFQLAAGQQPLAVLVLAAHPEIEYTLQRPELKELEENLARLSRLQPLGAEDVGPYVMFALRTVGYEGEPVFTLEAIERIAAQTRGVPRLVNTLCEAAFLVGYGQDCNPITADIVDAAADEIAGLAMEEPHAIDIEANEAAQDVEWVIEEIEPEVRPTPIRDFVGTVRNVMDGWVKRGRDWPVAAVSVGGTVALTAMMVLLFTVPFEDNEANARIRSENTALLERMDKLRSEVNVANQQRDNLQAQLDYQVEQRDLLAMQLEQVRDTAQAEPVAEVPLSDEVTVTALDTDSVVTAALDEKSSTTAEALLEELMKNAESEADAVAANSLQTSSAVQPSATGLDQPLYTVKVGDTLWNISQRHKLSVNELRALNGLESADNIFIGQQLKITGETSGGDPVAAAIQFNSEDTAWYTVKAGDSLYGISRQFDRSVDDLKRLNQLADAKLLVGQKLKVTQ